MEQVTHFDILEDFFQEASSNIAVIFFSMMSAVSNSKNSQEFSVVHRSKFLEFLFILMEFDNRGIS